MFLVISRTGRPYVPAGHHRAARYTERTKAEQIARALGNGYTVETIVPVGTPGAVRFSHDFTLAAY